MINYNDDLKFYKQERDRIESEIHDLKARIIVASGRGNRNEVNSYRQRINFLKIRLNELSQKIFDLENNHAQIQVFSENGIDSIRDGEINITDNIIIDRGILDDDVEIVETIDLNIERTVKFQNGKVIYKKETITENRTREIFKKGTDFDYIETVIK